MTDTMRHDETMKQNRRVPGLGGVEFKSRPEWKTDKGPAKKNAASLVLPSAKFTLALPVLVNKRGCMQALTAAGQVVGRETIDCDSRTRKCTRGQGWVRRAGSWTEPHLGAGRREVVRFENGRGKEPMGM